MCKSSSQCCDLGGVSRLTRNCAKSSLEFKVVVGSKARWECVYYMLAAACVVSTDIRFGNGALRMAYIQTTGDDPLSKVWGAKLRQERDVFGLTIIKDFFFY